MKVITLEDIVKNHKKYYGRNVIGYKCNNADGVDCWRIFLVNKNVYIISSDYVSRKFIPKSNNYNDWENQFFISFEEISNDYKAYYINKVAVAYMLEKEIWKDFAGIYSEYAIGGPTLEIFVESYNLMYPSKKIKYELIDDIHFGYKVKWDIDTNYDYLVGEIDISNDLYVLNSGYGMWLSSCSAFSSRALMCVTCYGYVSTAFYNTTKIGFGPIVCLKPYIKFIEELDGSLRII